MPCEKNDSFHNPNSDKPFIEVSGSARKFTKQMTPLYSNNFSHEH